MFGSPIWDNQPTAGMREREARKQEIDAAREEGKREGRWGALVDTLSAWGRLHGIGPDFTTWLRDEIQKVEAQL